MPHLFLLPQCGTLVVFFVLTAFTQNLLLTQLQIMCNRVVSLLVEAIYDGSGNTQ